MSDALAGKKTRCKACGSFIAVPELEANDIVDVAAAEQADEPAPKKPASRRHPVVEEDDLERDESRDDRKLNGRRRRSGEDDDEVFEDEADRRRESRDVGKWFSFLTIKEESRPAFEKWQSVLVLCFLGFIATMGTFSFYRDIVQLEDGQLRSLRVHTITHFLYTNAGKWGVVIPGIVLALGFFSLSLILAFTWKIPEQPRKKKKRRPASRAE